MCVKDLLEKRPKSTLFNSILIILRLIPFFNWYDRMLSNPNASLMIGHIFIYCKNSFGINSIYPSL